jgi:hypothetical protein
MRRQNMTRAFGRMSRTGPASGGGIAGSCAGVFAYSSGMYLLSLNAFQLLVSRLGPSRQT